MLAKYFTPIFRNSGLTQRFLEMIARNGPSLQRENPKVFVFSLFEVDSVSKVPWNKTELQKQLATGKAIPFHELICSSCHAVPKSKEWIAANETDEMNIFHISKRTGEFVQWEPIFIGTHADPHYDERLSWKGKSDKMTQAYAVCALDYEFQILDNAFLVHKPVQASKYINVMRDEISWRPKQLNCYTQLFIQN